MINRETSNFDNNGNILSGN